MKDASGKVVAGSSWLLANVAAVCLLGMLAIVVLDVAGRTFLGMPVPETIEIVSNLFMVGLVFLPLPLLEQADGHISVETFVTLLPDWTVRYVDTFVAVLSAGFYVILAYGGIGRAIQATRVGESSLGTTFNIPVWPSRWVVVVCFAVAAAAAARRVWVRRNRSNPT